MPTYAFTSAREISAAQREKIVESVTSIHQMEATAPRYFVQVIFYKVDPGSIFIGGEAAPADHIWVRADIRAGRTREQKAAILHRIMQETGEILQVSEQSVWGIYFGHSGRRRGGVRQHPSATGWRGKMAGSASASLA